MIWHLYWMHEMGHVKGSRLWQIKKMKVKWNIYSYQLTKEKPVPSLLRSPILEKI